VLDTLHPRPIGKSKDFVPTITATRQTTIGIALASRTDDAPTGSREQAGQIGFAVHPRRWVVERFIIWVGRNCRLAKDLAPTVTSATAFLNAASVVLLTRRLVVQLEIRVGLSRPVPLVQRIRRLSGPPAS